MTDFNAAAVTHVLSTAGEIISPPSYQARTLPALTSSALYRTGAALELECLKQSRFTLRNLGALGSHPVTVREISGTGVKIGPIRRLSLFPATSRCRV